LLESPTTTSEKKSELARTPEAVCVAVNASAVIIALSFGVHPAVAGAGFIVDRVRVGFR